MERTLFGGSRMLGTRSISASATITPRRPMPSGSTIGPRPTAAHSTTRMSMASVWTHPSLALARAASKIHCKASTLGERTKRAAMPSTINVIGALTHSILELTSTKTTELVQRTAGPAPPAAATLGCCKVSSQQAAQPTAMPTIRAFADRRNPK